jgi:hypothetical protein
MTSMKKWLAIVKAGGIGLQWWRVSRGLGKFSQKRYKSFGYLSSYNGYDSGLRDILDG